MRTTIFIRILTATLLPVLLVILIVIGTARNVIYQDGTTYARELVSLEARQLSEHMANKLQDAAVLQNDISKQMAAVDFDRPEAKQTVDGLLVALLFSNHSLYSAWFAFEPEVLPGNGRYYKTLIRADGEIQDIDDLSDEKLEASPWYSVSVSTGHVYADVNVYYDFRLGDGFLRLFTMTYPIITAGGDIIGCVGLDIRYEDLFSVNSFTADGTQRVMLASEDGMILFSSDTSDIGKSLWDYGFRSAGAVSQAIYKKSVWQEEIVSPLSGEKRLACLYPVEISHTGQVIYLYHDAPVSGLYGSFYSSMEIIVATGFLGIILLTFCVFFSTRDIARNVKRITGSFYRVANDSAEVTLSGEHIPIYQTNVVELETLQSALVSMMVQLRRAHGLKLSAVEAEVEKEKLIASSEAKTHFFAVMSHEIRTPMNAILGISEIMLYEGGLTPSQEKYIQDIKFSSDALLNIINDILDISKLETGKMELRPEHYNFRAIMDNIISLATQLARDANLLFLFEPEGELPLCLYGDGARLRQVLLNLIGNAIKFTREGHVLLRVFLQNETILFNVADTGIGIKKDEIGTIFEPFTRIDTRRNREVKGTGLGLSISKSLVELMGGTITVKSVYGQGSSFFVTVPLILGDERKLRRVKSGRGTHYSDSLLVLIVDDDKTNLNVSSGLLRAAHGIRCDTALSGKEAIAKVRETDYDIIFMDHMMPEMDGIDTTQHVRQLGGKYQRIPIIALTANAMIGTRKELIDGGMNDFLAKPIQSDKLQEILDTWVPGEKRLPETVEEESSALETAEPELFSNLSLLEKVGIDTLTGLNNIGFDEEMYLQSLRLLREKLPQTIPLLEDLLERQNVREFHIHVHGLKGSLASIGAALLSEEAERLESAALEENVSDCRALLPPLVEKLRQLLDALSEALPDEENVAENPACKERESDISLQKLCSALESHDYEAVTRELHIVLSVEHDPENNQRVSQIKRLIDSFDYPGAIAFIRAEMIAGNNDFSQRILLD